MPTAFLNFRWKPLPTGAAAAYAAEAHIFDESKM